MEEHQATLDVDSAVASIGADLFGGGEEKETPEVTETPVKEEPEDLELPVEAPEETKVTEEVLEPVVEAKPVPKTWPKEMSEHWAKTPKEVQDYWEVREKQMLDGLDQYKEFSHVGKTLTEVMRPYTPMLRASGVDEVTAVQTLLNANYRLTTGPIESKRAAFIELGQSLGLITQQNQQQVSPEIQQIRAEQEALKRVILERETHEYKQRESQVVNQVQDFAKAHPFFDEVADDIALFIKNGHELNEETYLKAVYANPVTRDKELARVKKEAQEKLVAKGKVEAAEARKSTSANVRSRDTGRSPTGITGTMEDTMKETLAKIKARTH